MQTKCRRKLIYIRFVSKLVLCNKYSRYFYLYSLSRHVSAYLMAILRRIVQHIKRNCYFYKGSAVFSTIVCVSCRQLIAVVFLCIKYFKYIVKILFLKYVMSKWLLRLLKLYKFSRCHMALRCSCVFSLLVFGGASHFP
jgi:hypothetical protein